MARALRPCSTSYEKFRYSRYVATRWDTTYALVALLSCAELHRKAVSKKTLILS
ncbi:hypothetical protein [Robiginitalea aurantiaca]|uniref:Transposase DDE domain-containing protein n=1 Tax=Robiginitalea aurantiaca TaxID=3056915 RepID=A0ABT7WIG3_9FLAO|nr:hypothetical protein [Robiginitalea aurantiaca]MDM9632714.1 hypothetical protein [Robiginitalea aurantiaca]